ncbi:hypothetical protein O1Q81_02084 [Lonepinella sp. MS14436]
MFYVYMLYSKDYDEFYLGSTSDLKRRYEQHINGLNQSTKKYKDLKLVYYEAYLTEQSARQREANLKRSGKAYTSLKQRIRESFETI